MRMIGMNKSLSSLFFLQKEFQYKILKNKGQTIELPIDSPEWFAYHTNAMVEELGECLKADKRWKTHRNAHYDRENKLEEIADIFITAINIALYSGFNADDIYEEIISKIGENSQKINRLEGTEDE